MSIFKITACGAPSPLSDMLTVQRAMALFVDPDHYVFLQSLPSAAWACFAGCELTKVCEWIQTNANGKGCYFGINPINEEIVKPSRVADVSYRRWILVDIDRNKTLCPDDSATENEHEDAKELTFEIMSYLSEIGFPAPIQVDSGNGFHLYYRVQLPNDKFNRDLVHGFLKILDNTFSCGKGNVGTEVFDARRIARIPGTWARRGMATKERQYRQATLVYAPKEIETVPAELLWKVVDAKPSPEVAESTRQDEQKEKKANPFEVKAEHPNDTREKAYGRSAMQKEAAKLAACITGHRHNQLIKSAFALGELVAGGSLTREEVREELFLAACECGLDKDDEHGGAKGVHKTIDDGLAYTANKPRMAPAELNGKHQKEQTPLDPTKRIIILASEVKPRKIEWLWQARIPLGKLTTFAGSGGLGKTFVLTDIAARVTRGLEWPDGSSGNRPGKVLYVSGEDDPEDTLVPRLIAAGGVREMVAYFKPEVLGQFNLERLDMLDIALNQLGTECLLVCIDPPTSFLGGADDHKNSELRALLTPLSEWATKRKVAVVFITHVNKGGGGGKIDAVMRIIGSVAWSNAVRAAHMFARDPDDPERRLFIGVKINGAKERRGLAYKVEQIDPDDVDGPAKVEWLGEVDTTANQALAGQSAVQTRAEAAAEWLVERFREKLEWESDELFRTAKEHNISRSAVFEAKGVLQLPRAKKSIRMGGDTVWTWWVPKDWSEFQNNGEPVEPVEENSSQEVEL